jgi:flagellar basal-body rod modification protein FlgD
MPYSSSPLTAMTSNTAPRAGFSQSAKELLSGEARETMGLGALPESTSAAGKTTLGKDDFLKLLLAQLSNQDPLKPMEDKEFIAQLAQFNSLEQMQQVNTHLIDMLAGMSLSQASSLLGRVVEAGQISGTVTGVAMADGKAKITVQTESGAVQVALSQVTAVVNSESDAEMVDETEMADGAEETEVPTDG